MRHRFALILFALLVCIQSCEFFRAPGKEQCDRIIGREKMAALLGDVYLLEAFLQEVNMRSPDVEDSILIYYNGLFEAHGVSRWEFQEALSCYLLHEKEMLQIHEVIMQRLSILESTATALRDSSLMAAEAGHLAAMEGILDTLSPGLRFDRHYQWWPAVAAFSVPFTPEPPSLSPDSLDAGNGVTEMPLPDSLLKIIDLPDSQ